MLRITTMENQSNKTIFNEMAKISFQPAIQKHQQSTGNQATTGNKNIPKLLNAHHPVKQGM